jgi:hypothetical protein
MHMPKAGSVGLLRRVTGFLDGLYDGRYIVRIVPLNHGSFIPERNSGTAHTGHGLDGLGHVPGAVGARHPFNLEFSCHIIFVLRIAMLTVMQSSISFNHN